MGIDWFEECVLIGGEFTDVDLQDASFVRANLKETTFDSVNLSEADLSATDLEGAQLRDINLRKATLEGARIENIRFSNVKVDTRTTFGETCVYEQDLADAAHTGEYLTLAQAATRTYQNIEQLYSENGLTADDRRFYRKRKDLQRRVAWHTQDYVTALLAEGSRWVTGYGISPWRVLGSALILIVVSAVLYPITGGITETVSTVSGTQTETWRISDPVEPFLPHATTVLFKSLYFSVVTFSTLGYGDISPVGSTARAIAGLEAFLGSLLMALLVFVLSRRIS